MRTAKHLKIANRVMEMAQLDASRGAYLDAICMLQTARKEVVNNIPDQIKDEDVQKILEKIGSTKKNYAKQAKIKYKQMKSG